MASLLLAAALAASITPSSVPATCAGDVFADQIGTRHRDRLRAAGRPERLFGLAGNDLLRGSKTRVACLFGGPGADRLDLDGGGGVAYGEGGGDTLIGSEVNDQFYGGAGLDAFDAGPGDDRVESDDGVPEVVFCRDGNDLVRADRIDVLVACETVVVNGPDAVRLDAPNRPVRRRETVRVRMTAPLKAGRGQYRVVIVTGALGKDCVDGPVEVARNPRWVKAGNRVVFKVSPPRRERWCAGGEKAAVVLARGRRPDRPVARFQFETRD
jgi:hypothetical protein